MAEVYKTLYPDGDGDLTEISLPAPPHWSVVLSYDGSYLTETSDTQKYDLYTKSASGIPVGVTITKVVWCAWYKYDYSVGWTGAIRPIIKYGGVVSSPAAAYGHNNNWDWQYGELEQTTNPLTGAAWTLDEINGMQIGITMQKGYTAGKYAYLDQYFAKVYYYALLPTVTTDPATNIGSVSATLNGTLDSDGGEASDCGFEWGETIAYGNTTATQNKTTGQSFSVGIEGLSPYTVYHFRAFATNSAGTGYGNDKTFRTKSEYKGNIHIDQLIYQHAERMER